MRFILAILLSLTLGANSFAGDIGRLNPPSPNASTSIKTAGYTIPASTSAYVVPMDWGDTLDSAEVCVISSQALTTAATGAIADVLILYQLNQKDLRLYDNVNVTISRTSGTKTLNTYALLNYTGILYGTNDSGIDNVLSVSTLAAGFGANVIYHTLDSAVTSVNRNLNSGMVTDTASTTQTGTAVASDPESAMFVFATSNTSNTSVFVTTVKKYKCPTAGFWVKTGQVLAGPRWLVTEYTSP